MSLSYFLLKNDKQGTLENDGRDDFSIKTFESYSNLYFREYFIFNKIRLINIFSKKKKKKQYLFYEKCQSFEFRDEL